VSAESEGDVAAELGTNSNLGKTIMSVCPAWRCPHQLIFHFHASIQRNSFTFDSEFTLYRGKKDLIVLLICAMATGVIVILNRGMSNGINISRTCHRLKIFFHI
jgi:hypothetical protein